MICTLELAKDHLRVDDSASDALITRYILQIEAVIFQYLEVSDIDDFYYEHGEGHNMVLENACLLGLTEIFENRNNAPLTAAAKTILRRYRNPAIADANDD